MTVETDKTCQHLRDQLVMKGEQERLRAMQALSYGYGTGSKAALATLLKAALGGAPHTDELLVAESDENKQPGAASLMGQIAEPMQHSANDSIFDTQEALTGF